MHRAMWWNFRRFGLDRPKAPFRLAFPRSENADLPFPKQGSPKADLTETVPQDLLFVFWKTDPATQKVLCHSIFAVRSVSKRRFLFRSVPKRSSIGYSPAAWYRSCPEHLPHFLLLFGTFIHFQRENSDLDTALFTKFKKFKKRD